MAEQKRSRSYRRIRVKTPGGRATIHYKERKKSKAYCAGCGTQLQGVSQAKGIAASKRNPSRPYAGVLCSACSRNKIKSMVR